MSAYNTIPQTTHDAEETLLQAQKPKTNLKALVGGAVAASFVLGVLAATAVSSAVAPRTASLRELCVGKSIPDECTPPDRDEIVGTSQGPWPEFKLV